MTDRHKGQLVRLPTATVEAIRERQAGGSLSYWATVFLNERLGLPSPPTPEQAKAAAGRMKKPRTKGKDNAKSNRTRNRNQSERKHKA